MNKRQDRGRRKLVLDRTTVRNLTAGELHAVAGGRPAESRVTHCADDPCPPVLTTDCPPPPWTMACPP